MVVGGSNNQTENGVVSTTSTGSLTPSVLPEDVSLSEVQEVIQARGFERGEQPSVDRLVELVRQREAQSRARARAATVVGVVVLVVAALAGGS